MPLIKVPENIFRAYDIRGIVDEGLNDDVMYSIGRAIGSEAIDQNASSLIVAADARLTSPQYSAAIIEGTLASGCDVINIGTVPSPILYFATHLLETGSGVMITGSHNPKNYNGVKIVLNQHCLAANQITHLKDRINSNFLHVGNGKLTEIDVTDKYIKRISDDIRLSRRWKVVIDSGNGVTGNVAPILFKALGCEVEPLFCDTDGNFPNHHPDPTREENLQDLITKVRETDADLGIAFDGDGDRVGLVSSSGRIIDADKMLMAFTRDILPGNPDSKIIFDVKSSFHLEKLIRDFQGIPVMCKSGHSYVKQKMQETAALLGGEYSAHIFFRHRWYGFDDGQYTACRFLELLDKNAVSADELLDSLPVSVSTPELHIPVAEDKKFIIMAQLAIKLKFDDATVSHLDGIRADFGDGWGLLRASNTTPCLTMRFEAESPEALGKIKNLFKQAILEIHPGLETGL